MQKPNMKLLSKRIVKSLCIAVTLLCFHSVTMCHDGEKIEFISDDEIETALSDWLKEIFEAAGMSIKPQVVIINTLDVNAAATYGGIVFVNAGLIIKCTKVEQLLGVLAHETGHIAGGHLAKISAGVNEAQVPAVASLILGGAATLLSGNPAGLLAGMAGGEHIFLRSMLRFSRTQEESADAFALKYLEKKKWPVDGLAEFFDVLEKQYGTIQEDPYMLTHPECKTRKTKILQFKESLKDLTLYKMSDSYTQKFERIRAKLFGFLKKPLDIIREYPESNTSFPAKYARLISHYVRNKDSSKMTRVLEMLESLKTDSPKDPYLYEMQGQFLFESGRIDECIEPLRKAVEIQPKALLIKLTLAHALIEKNSGSSNSDNLSEALRYLNNVVDQNPQIPFAWKLMGMAYGKQMKSNEASACFAEEAYLSQTLKLAKMHAERGKHCNHTPLKKRSEDILQQIKQKEEDSKQ
ncbi:MAG: hypothetical protein C0432_00455 [Candidatus Puniceispirillum sp.]|nr:hypothetical protein [Candidatus Pelagibacter sp.]MBA4282754.1 hypothetical protein [Candidatus Puniceispirillum sp.]